MKRREYTKKEERRKEKELMERGKTTKELGKEK
jgi:hypothetical protein